MGRIQDLKRDRQKSIKRYIMYSMCPYRTTATTADQVDRPEQGRARTSSWKR